MRVVGIDLGTSNTVVASAEGPAAPIALFPVPQRTGSGAREALPLFPSCAFAALEGELEPLPGLDEPPGWTLGAFAKRRGAEVPGRFVSSSKSWLSHDRVDKHSAILPWGAPEDAAKLSPVGLASMLLAHVRAQWDAAHPGAPLAESAVVFTVPASFDEVARELTIEAAAAAGVHARLLEEPQAAFYAALARGHLAPLLAEQKDVARVLVLDVGGGTTDLSLLEVRPDPLTIERVAVGSHLLLGGDNMDLALAHKLEPALADPGQRLDPAQWHALVLACQAAKERLLGDAPPDEVPVTLLARGSKLLGGARRASLTRAVAEEIVLQGFFPAVPRGEGWKRARGGLVAAGLPYEREVAITRHVAAFLDKHMAGEPLDAILFNGGVFRARAIRERVLDVLAQWHGARPREIEAVDPDTAVAIGAVVFGQALQGRGLRIGGGSPRAYFLGLGGGDEPRAVCVVPKGAQEGQRVHLAEPALRLLVGKPARFDVYASDAPSELAAGQVIKVAEHELDRLPPLATAIGAETGPAAASARHAELDVRLEAELTAVGTLDIACVEHGAAAGAPPRRFRLSFDLAEGAEPAAGVPSARRAIKPGALDGALERISALYGKGTSSEPKDAKNLLRELERLLGDKDAWSADDSRALADRFLSHVKGRRRSADHERVWFQLTGFCLRPGVGAPGDDARARVVAPLFAERLLFAKESRSWQQFFICFRRIAAGLDRAAQDAIRAELAPFVAPSEAKLKKPKAWKPESSDYEILELLSHLEHLAPQRRVELGDWVLERTWTKRDPRLWSSIGRIAARVPAYAGVDHVVAPGQAERFLDHLLRDSWSDLATAPRAAADMARATGDRARDVSEAVRAEVARRLAREGAPAELVRVVREIVPVAARERAEFFGEHLPAGLRLSGEAG